MSQLPASSDKEFQELFEHIKQLVNKALTHFDTAIHYSESNLRQSVIDTHALMDKLLGDEVDGEYISRKYLKGKEKWMKLD